MRELLERSRRLEKEVQQLKCKLASGQGGDLQSRPGTVGGVRVLAAAIEDADAKSLRDAADEFKAKLGTSVIVLASVKEGKVVLVAGVSADLTDASKRATSPASWQPRWADAAAGGRTSHRPAARSRKSWRPLSRASSHGSEGN